MASRVRGWALPEGCFERAESVDLGLMRLLRSIPMRMGLSGAWAMFEQVFPSRPLASSFLGGALDPVCPECGVETEEGTVAREGEGYRLRFGCGHERVWTLDELRARVV